MTSVLASECHQPHWTMVPAVIAGDVGGAARKVGQYAARKVIHSEGDRGRNLDVS